MSFAGYFPHLNSGGIYVTEDLHCSYWSDFEGGLYSPLSAMSFFKRLADIINHEHWRNNQAPQDLVARFGKEFGIDFQKLDFSQIHSVEFVNSICVIKKSSPENNVLGERVIAGRDEHVTRGVKKFDGALVQNFEAAIRDDRDLDVFELIARRDALLQSIQNLDVFEIMARRDALLQAVQNLEAQLAEQVQRVTEKERSIQELTNRLSQARTELEQLKVEILRYSLSRSWRFTRPARKFLQWIGRRKSVQ
jgi:hypothetical protein